MTPMLTHLQAAEAMAGGGIVAYPTEGVWGLGCNPMDASAVTRLLAIKQRDVSKGLILIAAHARQLERYVELGTLPADRLAKVLGSWPGANTWIVPAAAAAPAWITGAHRGIAVRVSEHRDVVALCRAFGGAVVSTSANLSGRPSPVRLEELDPLLIAEIDGICEGETGGRDGPSTIRDALSGDVLRG